VSTVRAHFDGRVFVPEEPVDCPKDKPLRLTVEPIEDRSLLEFVRVAEALPDDPTWPTDGAAEHDHYLYGTPKKNR
jgi:hypothetical protein